MSDLAPFVAAAIRDRVVKDMAKEIRGLEKQKEEELAPWTVTIHGPQPAEGGAPKVYAWASVSMEHVLTKTLRGWRRNVDEPYVSVKNFEYTEHPFRWRDFLSSHVTVFCSRTSDNSDLDAQQSRYNHVSFDDNAFEVGRGFGMKSKTEGQRVISKKLWVHWWWFSSDDNLNSNKCVADAEITVPIASEHLDRVTPEFIGEVPLVRRHFLRMANEVADADGPVKYVRVTLNAKGLVSLLTGHNSSESDSDDDDDDDDDDDHSSEDGDHSDNDDMSIEE